VGDGDLQPSLGVGESEKASTWQLYYLQAGISTGTEDEWRVWFVV